MSHYELLKIEAVKVDIYEGDLSGMPKNRVTCSICGDQVQDNKELVVNSKPVCGSSANGPNYTRL